MTHGIEVFARESAPDIHTHGLCAHPANHFICQLQALLKPFTIQALRSDMKGHAIAITFFHCRPAERNGVRNLGTEFTGKLIHRAFVMNGDPYDDHCLRARRDNLGNLVELCLVIYNIVAHAVNLMRGPDRRPTFHGMHEVTCRLRQLFRDQCHLGKRGCIKMPDSFLKKGLEHMRFGVTLHRIKNIPRKPFQKLLRDCPDMVATNAKHRITWLQIGHHLLRGFINGKTGVRAHSSIHSGVDIRLHSVSMILTQ